MVNKFSLIVSQVFNLVYYLSFTRSISFLKRMLYQNIKQKYSIKEEYQNFKLTTGLPSSLQTWFYIPKAKGQLYGDIKQGQ